MLEVEVENADPEGNHTIYLCGKVYKYQIKYLCILLVNYVLIIDLVDVPARGKHHFRLLQPRSRQGPGVCVRTGDRRRSRQPGRRKMERNHLTLIFKMLLQYNRSAGYVSRHFVHDLSNMDASFDGSHAEK